MLAKVSLRRVIRSPWRGRKLGGLRGGKHIRALSTAWRYSYYRTATQVEIDLVLETPTGETWAVENKTLFAPTCKKAFTLLRRYRGRPEICGISGPERFAASRHRSYWHRGFLAMRTKNGEGRLMQDFESGKRFDALANSWRRLDKGSKEEGRVIWVHDSDKWPVLRIKLL